MARYIDADALGIGKADRNSFTTPEYADGWNSAIKIIANAPTADVVEVVRCKDCKYNAFEQPNGTIHCHAKRNLICEFRNPDDFCNYGERK